VGPCLTFQIGERVVYPNQGVGTIENISTRYFGSQMERFYLLRLASNSMTIMVPFSHVGDVGLRKVTRSSEIKKVLEYLATGKARKMADWKNRFKENSERMRCGSIFEVAEVFKILLLQQMEKTLSFREKKMLDRARQMIISEVSTSMALGEDGSIDLIAKSLSRAGLPMPEPM
jgi:CarD family transcriptional regulator